MTNLAALQSTISVDNENLYKKVLIDNELSESETYTKSNAAKIDLCKAAIIEFILSESDFSEGNLSIKYDRAELAKERNRILNTQQASGAVTQNTIYLKNASDRW